VIVGIILEVVPALPVPFVGGYISASYNLAIAFGILALVILFRPRGLFTNARRTVFE